jgi:hypothetical protein
MRVLFHESTATQRRGYNKTFGQHAQVGPSNEQVNRHFPLPRGED